MVCMIWLSAVNLQMQTEPWQTTSEPQQTCGFLRINENTVSMCGHTQRQASPKLRKAARQGTGLAPAWQFTAILHMPGRALQWRRAC